MFFILGRCEENKVFTLPKSRDQICFLAKREGVKTYDEAHDTCRDAGFDGNLELRYEEDANFTQKLMYCSSKFIQNKQPGNYKKYKYTTIGYAFKIDETRLFPIPYQIFQVCLTAAMDYQYPLRLVKRSLLQRADSIRCYFGLEVNRVFVGPILNQFMMINWSYIL